MRLLRAISAGLLILATTGRFTSPVPAAGHTDRQPTASAHKSVIEAYAQTPLSFERNAGQTDPQVEFFTRGAGYAMFLTKGGDAVVSLAGPDQAAKVLRLSLLHANGGARGSGRAQLPGVLNYLIGNDASKWRRNVASFEQVAYLDVYPGIDLLYYGNQHQLEYDFIVQPGGDPMAIALEAEGADRMEIDVAGDLVLHLGSREVRHRKPVVYQMTEGARREITGAYRLLDENRVTFDVGAYDAALPLVIDPILVYGTLLDGSSHDWGRYVAADAAGNSYITGGTSSPDFPTLNAFDATYSHGGDIFVTKLDPAGAIAYSTYLGTSGSEEVRGIVVDANGCAHITGTAGGGFPTTPGAYDPTHNLFVDAFVTKLDPTGSALAYSTFLGGNAADEGRGIAIDSGGSVYVTGTTESVNFPTTAGAYDRTHNGSNDVFVTKFNPLGGLVYSTLLGSPANEQSFGISVDAVGSAYVTGRTESASFPTTIGAYDTSFAGPWEAFVTKVDPDGGGLGYSTFFRAQDVTVSDRIAVDGSGNAVLAGWTFAYPATQAGMVAKLDASGSSLIYLTSLPGSPAMFTVVNGVAVDPLGNAYVTGNTGSPDFPVTANVWDETYNGGAASFLTRLTPSGDITYSTYIGGSPNQDYAHGIAVDANDDIYITGVKYFWGMPTSAAFVMKFDLDGTRPTTVEIAPPVGFSVAGQQHCVTATVRDNLGDPVPNVSVEFWVVGSDGASGDRLTNASGVATFCYHGWTVNTESVNAWADTNGDHHRNAIEPDAPSAINHVFFRAETATGIHGETATLTAKLAVAGQGLGGRTVNFTLLGQPVGQALTDTNGVATLAVSLAGINVGEYPGAIVASFAGDAEAPAGVMTRDLAVFKATPIVTWNPPSAVAADTVLGSSILNATASVPGTFSYSPGASTVLVAGKHAIALTFSPTDTANFIGVWRSKEIDANVWTAASQPELVGTFTGNGAAVDPVRDRVYVKRDYGLSVLDARTHAELTSTSIDTNPSAIAIDLEAPRLVTTDWNSSWLHVYNATSLTETERIQLDPRTGYTTLAFDGATGLAWAGNHHTLVAVDLNAAPGDPLRVRTTELCATTVAVNPGTGYVYAACANGSLIVIDGNPSRGTFGQSVGSLTLPAAFWTALAVDGRRNEIYIASTWPEEHPELFTTVTIVDGNPSAPTFNSVIGTLDLGSSGSGLSGQYLYPVAIGVNPVTERVYVKASVWGYPDYFNAVIVFDAISRNPLSMTVLPHELNGGIGPMAVNPATNTIYVAGQLLGAIRDTVTQSASTPAGTHAAPVTVTMTAVNLTFADVTTTGVTTATPIDATAQPLNLPGQFSIEGAPAYDITTTASHATPITLCFAVGVDDPDVFADLVILHGVNGSWVPETTTRDFDSRQLCATVSSLSPFALGRLRISYQVQPLFDASKAFNGNATASLKVRLLNAGGVNVSAPAVTLRATRLVRVGSSTPSPVEDAGRANAGGYFRYEASSGGYAFNLRTKGLAAGTYILSVRAGGDPVMRTVQFQVK